MKHIVFIFLAGSLLAGCKETNPYFDFKPLSDFKYKPVNIEDGTKVRIISFSGGPDCTPERSYYYQFICIPEGTRDTIRILSPCQVIEEGEHQAEGIFSDTRKASAMADSALLEHGENVFETGKKIVVCSKQNKMLENREFKTAIGAISF